MSERKNISNASRARWGAFQIDRQWYSLLVLCVLAQTITVVLTWRLWQVREYSINLPLLDGPWISFGAVVLVSLIYVLIDPRRGAVIHIVVLAIACLADQYRIQPQFLSISILIFGCSTTQRQNYCRWYLIAMWFWAGTHKIFSPEWPMIAWNILERSQFDADNFYQFFSWVLAIAEIILGIAAVLRPRLGAILCVVLHGGIALFMSPLFFDFNASVIPWNLATAIVGFALFWNATASIPATRWGRVVVAGCLLLPVGFYGGWVDRGLAFVLYSGNMPRAAMTTKSGRQILGDEEYLGVPFPREQRHFHAIFEKMSNAGDKLHVTDRRPWSSDQFFVMGSKNIPLKISKIEFSRNSPTEVKGVFLGDPVSIFNLQRYGAKMLARESGGAVYAVEFDPKKFNGAVLRYLKGLPNLEQIQLADCDLIDEDLRALSDLDALVGVGLSNTPISDRGLMYLSELKNLRVIEHQGSSITSEGLENLLRVSRPPESLR